MDRQTIAAGWLTLRPFTPDDIPWVYEVLLDPVLRRFMQVPSPYRLEDAASHVEQAYIGSWYDGRRAEVAAEDAVSNIASRRVAEKAGFLIEGTLRKRRVCHSVRVDEWVGSLLRDEAMAGTCSR